MDLKEYIEECDKYGHRYFMVDEGDMHFGICNNHVIADSRDRKGIVKELNHVLKILVDTKHIDKIFEKKVG